MHAGSAAVSIRRDTEWYFADSMISPSIIYVPRLVPPWRQLTIRQSIHWAATSISIIPSRLAATVHGSRRVVSRVKKVAQTVHRIGTNIWWRSRLCIMVTHLMTFVDCICHWYSVTTTRVRCFCTHIVENCDSSDDLEPISHIQNHRTYCKISSNSSSFNEALTTLKPFKEWLSLSQIYLC